MLNKDVLFQRLDQATSDELGTISIVPALLFIVAPLVDVVVCIANNYIHPDTRTVFYDIVSTWIFPLSVLFALGTAFCVLWRRMRGLERTSKNRAVTYCLFAILLALAFASTLLNEDNPNRFSGYYPSMVGMNTYALFVLVYFWSSSHASKERLRRLICDLLCLVSVLVGIHALWIAISYGAPNFIIREQPEGIFYNTNHYGYYLTVVVVLSATLLSFEQGALKRLFYLIIFVFNTIVLILNNTFGAYLACIVGLAAMLTGCWLTRRSCIRSSIAVTTLFFTLLVIVSIWDQTMLSNFTKLLFDINLISGNEKDADSAGSGRWRLWRATIGFITQRPLLGWGADGFADALKEVAGNPRTHCEPLMYAAFFGIPTAICYLSACASVLVTNVRERLALNDTTLACVFAALAYFASSLVGNMCFYTAPLFFILMGMSFAQDE